MILTGMWQSKQNIKLWKHASPQVLTTSKSSRYTEFSIGMDDQNYLGTHIQLQFKMRDGYSLAHRISIKMYSQDCCYLFLCLEAKLDMTV